MTHPPERFMDEIDACTLASQWIEAIGKEAYTRRPDVEIQRYGLSFPWDSSAMPGGGVITLCIGCHPRAVATMFRDDRNFTILCRVEYPEQGG